MIGDCWPGEGAGRLIRSVWLGVHSWLSLIGPKLEVGTKIRETISYESNSDFCGGVLLQGLLLSFLEYF